MGQLPDMQAGDFKSQGVLRSADLLALQSVVLESVARGERLQITLDVLCRRIELLAPEVHCSVLLLEGDRVRHGAAPSLPKAYTDLIDGLQIGPLAGSCGTAAYTRHAVLAEDIATDPRWGAYREFALPHGLRACWSSPITGRDGRVLGTFALYYAAPGKPAEFHRHAVEAALHLAAIAIERHEMVLAEQARLRELEAGEIQLEALNENLERRVAERTSALDQRNAELTQTLDELRRTQGALIETRKLLSLGRLVAGVAHELNTPIGNARLLASSQHERSERMRARLAEGGLRRSELEAFIAASCEAGELLDTALRNAIDLLASFRAIVVQPGQAQRARVNLRELVDAMLVQLAAPLKLSASSLHCELAEQIELDTYPAQLQQVLGYVLSNAIEHGVVGRADGAIVIRAAFDGDGEILLTIADNGHGISARDLKRVFDPFFTTRMGAGGPGLGLHIVYTLVNGLLGGQIEIDSAPEQGTRVYIRLPVSAPLHTLPQQ